MFRKFVLTLGIVVLAMAVFVQPAGAVIRSNTIDPDATLWFHGRVANLTGPIACDTGNRLWVEFTVTQESTGAWGKGLAYLNCTGEVQRWSVYVLTLSWESFEPGHAEACAFGVERQGFSTVDTREWCAVNGITFS